MSDNNNNNNNDTVDNDDEDEKSINRSRSNDEMLSKGVRQIFNNRVHPQTPLAPIVENRLYNENENNNAAIIANSGGLDDSALISRETSSILTTNKATAEIHLKQVHISAEQNKNTSLEKTKEEENEEEDADDEMNNIKVLERRAALEKLDKLVEYQTSNFSDVLASSMEENPFAWIVLNKGKPLKLKLNAVANIDQSDHHAVVNVKKLLMVRGPVGELPIHIAGLLNKWELVKAIVNFAKKHGFLNEIVLPGYGTEVINGELKRIDRAINTYTLKGGYSPYLGENILHIAIVNKQLNIIWFLLCDSDKYTDMKLLLKARATGEFFHRGQPCYYGEFVTNFALCTKQLSVLRYLVAQGADLLAQDSNGNNAFHLTVERTDPAMYDHIMKILMQITVRDENELHEISADAGPTYLDFQKSLQGLREKMEQHKHKKEKYKKNEKTEKVKEEEDKDDEGDDDGAGDSKEFLFKGDDEWINHITVNRPTMLVRRKYVILPYRLKFQHRILGIDVDRTPYVRDDTKRWFHPWEIPNYTHLTPLMLASTGNKTMFNHLMDKEGQELWKYGPTSCHTYHMGRLEEANKIIVRDGTLNLAQHPSITHLSTKKWERFARKWFYWRFFIIFFVLLSYTICVVLRSTVKTHTPDHELINHIVMAIIWCGGVLPFCLYKAYTEIRQFLSDPVDYVELSTIMENSLSLSSSLMVVIITIIHIVYVVSNDTTLWSALLRAEQVILAVCSLTAYCYLFFFLLGFYMTGPFLVMVRRMMVSDIVRWIIIFIVFLFGFTNALYVLQGDGEANGLTGWANTLNTHFQILTGGYDPDDAVLGSTVKPLSTILAIVYVLLIVILLLNILIAMMSKTFEDVYETAAARWYLEKARIIDAIQDEIWNLHTNEEYRYWIEVAASKDQLECYNCIRGSEDILHKGKLRRVLRVDAVWD